MIVFFSRSLLRNTMELIEICSCFCFNKKIPFFNCDSLAEMSIDIVWENISAKYLQSCSKISSKNIFHVFSLEFVHGVRFVQFFSYLQTGNFKYFLCWNKMNCNTFFSWMLLFWRIIIQWNLTFTFVLVWCLEIRKSLIS